MKTLLTYKDSEKPFVTQKGKKFYIDGIEYKDDPEILLRAIAAVKPTTVRSIGVGKTKEEYWQNYFNYQWNGGTLILWHNPTELWKQELTRQGKVPCEKCGRKLIMYYGSRCPICDFKGKDRKNLLLMEYFIEAKHGITLRDYAAKKHGVKDSFTHNFNHKIKWENDNFPIPEEYATNPLPDRCLNQKGMDWYETPAGRKFFDDRRKAYEKAPDGECKEIEKQDWWVDCICDNYDIRNDSVHRINFGYILSNCTEDWQREITQLFVDEFGKKDIFVEISW